MKFVAVALATLSVAHSAAAYKGRHNEPQFRGRAIDHRALLDADILYDCLDDCLDDQLSSFDGVSSIEQSLDECNAECVDTAVTDRSVDPDVAEGMVDCLGKCTKDVAKTYEKEFDKAVEKAVEDCEDDCDEGDTDCVEDCSSGDVSDVSTNSAESKATREGDKCYQECVPETVQDFKAALKASGKTTLKAIRQAEQSFAREMNGLEACFLACPDEEFGSLDGSDLSDLSKSGDIEDDLDECSQECVENDDTRGLVSRAEAEAKGRCIASCNKDATKKFEKELDRDIDKAVKDCEDSCESEDEEDQDKCEKDCSSGDKDILRSASVDGKKAIKEADECYFTECGVGDGRYKAALKVARRKLA